MTNLDITIWRGLTYGPQIIFAVDAFGAPYNLVGWTVFASVRKESPLAVILNLSPMITGGAAGEITIELVPAITLALAEGVALWDLVLQTPTGRKLGPYIGGNVVITTPITQP